jgi:hypothetical protein
MPDVRQTDTGAIVVDDRWVWCTWARWKPLTDQKDGKPGRKEINHARDLVGGNPHAMVRAQEAGEQLLKAVKKHGSLQAAEQALSGALPPVQVKTYSNAQEYESDVPLMTRRGFVPQSVVGSDGRLTATRMLTMGVFALAAKKGRGQLTVTWVRQT